MKPDIDIKKDVDAELRWNPEIDDTDIATKVNKGVVTLTGFVHTFLEKYRAEMTVIERLINNAMLRAKKGAVRIAPHSRAAWVARRLLCASS